MFVAILVAVLATGDIHTEVSSGVYDKPECEALVRKVEENVRANEAIVAFASKCVEIKKDDVKAGGKQA